MLIYQYQKKTVRKMILKDHKRPDGRAMIRFVRLQQRSTCLQETHGSANVHKEGQTQICTITTLAPLSDGPEGRWAE